MGSDRLRWGVTARMTIALATIIVSFGGALAFSVGAQKAVLRQLEEVRREEELARAALRLANEVRDLYVRQTHAILRDEPNSKSVYEEQRGQVRAAVEKLLASARTPELVDKLRAVQRATEQMDLIFTNQILGGIAAGDWVKVRSELERAEREVLTVVLAVAALESDVSARVHVAGQRANRQMEEARRLATLLWIVAFLISVGAAGYMLASVARPLRKLEQGVRRIGEGQLDERLSVDSSHEVGRLARGVNQMAAALKDHQVKLVQAEKLAGLGRIAAGVAHELNNPLGVILGYARLLKKQMPTSQEELDIIADEVRRCQHIIDELLGLVRNHEGERDEVFDLAEVVKDVHVRQSTDPEPRIPNSRVELSAMAELPVRGDPDRIAQVAANLLRNARQAAGEQGRVLVRARAQDGSVLLTVEDSGPGLSEDARSRLFEPFFTTKERGTGLGLALSLAIVQSHRGSLEAGQSPLGGASFTVKLPLEPRSRA
jgi:two-component system NtrC family sensor kinase